MTNKKKNIIIFSVLFAVLVAVSFAAPAVIFHFLAGKVPQIPYRFWTTSTYRIAVIGCFIALTLVVVYALVKYQLFGFAKAINRVDRATSDAHGDSRWQTDAEMEKRYGCYDFDKLPEIETEGYVVKSRVSHGKLLVSTVAMQHCLVVGTTGTGKSAYYLGTTIQANAKSKTKSSMVINDLKGELYSKHSKMLAEQGYNVIKLDLRNPHISDRYNPLSLIWDLYHQYQETHEQNIIDRVSVYINEVASILCPVGKGDQQQWSQGAQAIIKSIIWAILEDSTIPEFGVTKDMFTILQISNIVNRQKSSLENFLRHRNKYSPVFDYAGMILDNPSEKTVGSYYATLSTALEGFLEPGLQKITSATDIDVTKLALEPTAVFVIIPDELKTRNIVGTMIVSQIYNYLTFQASQMPGEKLPKNVYFLLDEFGNLPIIPNFPQWVALSRGRGIFFNLIVQADSQLESVYGKDDAKTIMQNCHLQMLLGANEIETLKHFEDLFGKCTIYQRSASIDTNSPLTDYRGTTSITSKDLITLDQLQRIPRGTAYFKILREFPCKTQFVGIFEPSVAKILKTGTVQSKIVEHPAIDRAKTYYDLTERERIVDEARKIIAEAAEKPQGGGDRNTPSEAAPQEEEETPPTSSKRFINKKMDFINR